MYGSNDLLTGYAYEEFYDWDLYFENIYLSYFGVSQFCRSNIEKFLEQQLTSGFVARTLINPRWRQHFKPFMAQTALLGARQTGSLLWLQDKFYQRMKKYLEYWFWNCDHDRNGLAVWESADASGMDNQVQRAGELYSETIEGVDLTKEQHSSYYLHFGIVGMKVLERLVESPQYQSLSALTDGKERQVFLLDKALGEAKKVARREVLRRYPELARQVIRRRATAPWARE